MPEIVNWREVLESIGGGVGTATAECLSGSGSDFGFDLLLELPIFSNEEIKISPLFIFGDSESITLPYFQEGKLLYLRKRENGEYDFHSPFVKGKYSKVVEYIPEDLPEILKATYKYFARDRTYLHRIMDWFNSHNA